MPLEVPQGAQSAEVKLVVYAGAFDGSQGTEEASKHFDDRDILRGQSAQQTAVLLAGLMLPPTVTPREANPVNSEKGVT